MVASMLGRFRNDGSETTTIGIRPLMTSVAAKMVNAPSDAGRES